MPEPPKLLSKTMKDMNAELQKQRGYYLNAMAVADRALTNWFLHHLGVHWEQMETFFRLVDTGNLGARIELFAALGDGPEHREVARRLKEANTLRNRLAHGQILPAPDPNSSFPTGEEWEVEESKRKGPVTTPISAAHIEAKRGELKDALDELTRLTVALPKRARES